VMLLPWILILVGIGEYLSLIFSAALSSTVNPEAMVMAELLLLFFDGTKGLNTKIDYFDYSNIKGRAGRLMVHYTVTIYNFNPIPPNQQVIIDIPFYEQNPISDEILIHLDEIEVRNTNSTQYEKIKSIPNEEKG